MLKEGHDEKDCWGIDVAGNKIYVACYRKGKEDAEIRIFGLFGDLMNSFYIYKAGSQILKSVTHICVNNSHERLYVTDPHTNTVLCLTTTGKLVYENKEIKGPKGLCVDDKDKIYVCDKGHKVESIDSKGRKDKTTFSTESFTPSSVAFSGTVGRIVVGCTNSEYMSYYKLP